MVGIRRGGSSTTALLFADTNLLVYARDATEPEKQPRAQRWIEHLWRSGSGRLSTQVLSEYYITTTRKLRPGLPAEAARADIRNLLAWRPVAVDGDIIASAWGIEDRYRLNFWDALIVAAALAADCRYLLTEEMQDGADFDGLHVVNPLVAEVGSLAPLR